MVNNNNIYVRHLRDKGLHLNQSGSNFLNTMERFWHTKGCLDISNNRLVESEHLLRPESTLSSKRNNRSLTTGFIENLKGKKRNVQLLLKSISVPKETSLFPPTYTIRTNNDLGVYLKIYDNVSIQSIYFILFYYYYVSFPLTTVVMITQILYKMVSKLFIRL